MPPRFFSYSGLWIHLIYSLVVIISCFLIYFKTKELYELTSHKGIKYFRNTFLFFGITHIARLFLHVIRALRINPLIAIPSDFGIFETTFFFMVYASSMAFIYLLYSIFWKKIDRYPSSNVYVFHIFALIIAFLSILEKIPLLFLVFQGGLFFLLIIVSLYHYKETRHREAFSQVYLIYLLIFALSIISNILEFIAYFSPNLGLVIYALSVVLFLIVLFKVLRKVSSR